MLLPPVATGPRSPPLRFRDVGPAERGTNRHEVVIGVSPAFGTAMTKTIIGIPHGDVLHEVMAGIEEEGLKARLVKVNKTADVGFIAHEAAKLSGSGIGIGIISRGTTVIHQRDLAPLSEPRALPAVPAHRAGDLPGDRPQRGEVRQGGVPGPGAGAQRPDGAASLPGPGGAAAQQRGPVRSARRRERRGRSSTVGGVATVSDQLSTQVEHLARARGLDISPDVVAEAVKRVMAALGDAPTPPSGNGRGGSARSGLPVGHQATRPGAVGKRPPPRRDHARQGGRRPDQVRGHQDPPRDARVPGPDRRERGSSRTWRPTSGEPPR